MNATAPPPRPTTVSDADVLSTTRLKVRDMFSKSAAFQGLSQAQQKDIARNTVEILRYLAAPEGIPGNTLARPNAGQPRANGQPHSIGLAGERAAEDEMTGKHFQDVANLGKEGFQAEGAREGAKVAGLLLQKVNFPTFVSGLIEGVFHAIVKSSIEQMEAYGKLVADIAKTLNQFRDEHVTDNQGRDHLAEQFSDLFTIEADDGADGGPRPRVRLRDDVDEKKALARVNSLPIEGGPLKSLDLDDEDTEQKLVQAARTQLATSRQQLLATMVLMGINRIIVTDGKISAKVLYDFQARDNRRFQRSAAAYDYARDQYGNLQKTRAIEGTYENTEEGRERNYSRSKDSTEWNETGGSSYAKGEYKYSEQPVMTAMSAASESSDAALQTKASLAGIVEVNFKSETFPLEKMADSFQIGMIQNAAKPKGGAASASAPASGSPGAGAAPATTPGGSTHKT